MSIEKNMNARIQHKHDTEANWNKAINFIPKIGEIIVYDIDENYNYSRFKIGDGIRTISNLEFSETDLTGYATESYVNEGLATKQPIGDYALKSEIGGKAIIDVIALPTEDIREDVFYRLMTGTMVLGGTIFSAFICRIVSELPEIGEPVVVGDLTDIATARFNIYYNASDNNVSGYVTEDLSTGIGVPTGWYPAETLISMLGTSFSGVITDIRDSISSDGLCLLLEYVTYSYKDEWTSHKIIGRLSGGLGGETFNSAANTATGVDAHAEGGRTNATGDNSHAEGFMTTAAGSHSHAEGSETSASGHNSHAEGMSTSASGYNSHAEGMLTSVSGYNSHAEGYQTRASGDNSHAEGDNTRAKGYCSHAEGSYTESHSEFQHVQGRYNIVDTDVKYAHIVGNGAGGTRSNAHTIDWDGNAWFAGDVYVGSTSGTNKDDGSVKLAKITDIPDSIPTPTTATIGQTVVIKAVDENGKPTEWEAVDMPDVSGQINAHNTATDSHNDIRLLVEGLTTRLNTLADSDDTTLDQMSEIVAYIKSNKTLIEEVTTNKVNVTDIIDNLTTNVANKPLSAAQGVALKALIDAIIVPTKVSELTNDSGYLTSYTETDPTVPSWAKTSSKPTYTASEVGLGNVDNVKQYSVENPPPYPVTSVNGSTGEVTINAVPSCTTSNNGQFLRVVDGVATWSTISNAEEATF